MKFSLNLLFFFSGSRKRWKGGKGGEEEGGREKEVGGGPTLFSLCQLFRMPRSSLALKKKTNNKKHLFAILTALGIISYGTSSSSNFSAHSMQGDTLVFNAARATPSWLIISRMV